MSGPFETEREAHEAAHQYTGPAGAALISDPAVAANANRAMLTDACNAAGVALGAYDRQILDWLAGYEPATCAVVASLIARAAVSG